MNTHPSPAPKKDPFIFLTPEAVCQLLDDTILPRLHALDADVDRTFVLHKEFLDRAGPFRLPTHSKTLRRALADSHAVSILLILDEAARVPDDLYRAVTPMLAVSLLPRADMGEADQSRRVAIRMATPSGHQLRPCIIGVRHRPGCSLQMLDLEMIIC